MFDTIKEWLSGLLGGATEHIENAQQSVGELNPAEHLSDAAANLGEQAQGAADQANELKDNLTNK